MKNNLTIIIIILVILLILTSVLAVYFYLDGQSKTKKLESELEKTKLGNQEKNVLEAKITDLERKKNKGLEYVEYLNVIIFPFLRDSGIVSRFNFENDMKWFLEVQKRTEKFNNQELSSYLEKLQSNDQKAFGLILNWVLGEIEKILK